MIGLPEMHEIAGHLGYFVSDDGFVWTSKVKGGNDRTPGRRGPLRKLAIQRSKRGYCLVNLDVDGRNRSRLVHQLVLEAFVGPKPPGLEGCHYPDHDKANNRVSNLRWDTHDENIRDNYRDRLSTGTKVCSRCGHPKKLDEFYTDKRASDGRKSSCKSCHNDVSVATRDPEKKRKANREYARRLRAEAAQ